MELTNKEIEKIKSCFTQKINAKILERFDIIAESFTDYFGECFKKDIITRFKNILLGYYLNDLTIFQIYELLKNGEYSLLKNIESIIPYVIHLGEKGFYRQEVTSSNFYEMGLSKLIGVSDESIFSSSDKKLIEYLLGIILRKDNENPMEFNYQYKNDLKRIITLHLFSSDDENLFHELTHAICSEIIITKRKAIVRCGIDFSDGETNLVSEIINDLISKEIYKIFKSKCQDSIMPDNIMKNVLFEEYPKHYHLLPKFYEDNKEKIKVSAINHLDYQLDDEEIVSLSN